MANLIPPDAKRDIKTDYWIRVVTLWLVMIATAVIVVIVFLVPTLVLIESQLQAYDGTYGVAKERAAAYEEARVTIQNANELAALLSDEASTTSFSMLMNSLDTIAGNSVTILSFELQENNTAISTIVISGVADTRTALAEFSRDIEANPLFSEAKLPISNLTKERDISFSLSITPAENI